MIYGQGSIRPAAYLRMYGYLTDAMPDSNREPSRDDMTRAIKYFQRFTGLDITGELDTPTLAMMERPRCGCPDILMNKTNQPLPFRLGGKWSKTFLTWKVTPGGFSRKLSQSAQLRAIRDALKVWSDVTPLRFSEITGNQRADINIFFASGDHGDGFGNRFDGRGRVLAHAFFPESGQVHFDEDELWVIRSNSGTDLFTVAAHEFGHALGLSHSEISGALMAPYYAGYDPNFQLHQDDVRGIQQLYGPRNVPQTRPTRPKTTLRPTRPRVRTTTPVPPRDFDISCGARLKGMVRDFTGDIWAFWRQFVIRMDDQNGVGSNRRQPISDVFPYFPRGRTPDAVFNILRAGRVYLIRSRRIYQYKYDNGNYILERPDGRMTSQWLGNYWDVPERPRAAFAVTGNEIYMFGSSQVWRYNAYTNQIIPGSHEYISTRFPGIPYSIDGAMMWDDRTVYFITGSYYYTYDLQQERVTRGPRQVGADFFKGPCSRQ